MRDWGNWISIISVFGLLSLSSDVISRWFSKYRLPLISGLLLTGMLIGPHILGVFKVEEVHQLTFLLDFSLAYIAFAAGSELYLKELRGNLNSIKWNTISQLSITFLLGGVGVYILSSFTPFLKEQSEIVKWIISMLFATIFVARSPSSAIAIISELRAKGPFTRLVMGVTVVADVLVVILFAIVFSLSKSLMSGESFNVLVAVQVFVEIVIAIIGGIAMGRFIAWVLSFSFSKYFKTAVILLSGLSVYILEQIVGHFIYKHWGLHIHLEPLLICIVAGFYVTNYTRHRPEFHRLLETNGPWIFVIFFTLTGASLSLDMLLKIWDIALLLFLLRLLTIAIASYVGGVIAKDPPLYKKVGWMPYVTQAGVGIGLAAEVAVAFPEWGDTFFTIVIGMIIISQVIGPVLFKKSLISVKEDHQKGKFKGHEGSKNVIIFGFEDQAILLARRFQSSGWKAVIATKMKREEIRSLEDVDIIHYDEINESSLSALKAGEADGVILFNSDENNLKLAELLYEKFGISDIVVRLQDWSYYDRFKGMGVRIVESVSALVNLIEHYVISPQTTALVLGEIEGKDSRDIEVRDRRLHGQLLRNLRLPSDVLILSVKRKGQVLITHGYTRLRIGDILTVVGSKKSLDHMALMLEES